MLLVTFDGVRKDHLSGFGYAGAATPHIDGLLRDGAVYRDVIVPGCSTKPSLTSLMVGVDFDKHRHKDHTTVIEASYVTLAEVFQAQGYRTGAVVGSPVLTREAGFAQGFEVFEDFDQKHQYVRADEVADRALAFLSHTDKRPFFLYLHFEEPHPPWFGGGWWSELFPGEGTNPFSNGCTFVPTPQQRSKAQASGDVERWVQAYDHALQYADAQLGRVLDFLRRSRSEVTIGFTTDHGYDLGERVGFTHGMTPFEEVANVFFVIAKLKGTGPAASQTSSAPRLFDLGPTLLGQVGLPIPATYDGVDVLNQLQEIPVFAYTYAYGSSSVRDGRYKLTHLYPYKTWKVPNGYPPYMLFDLQDDPREQNNAIHAQPDVVSRLKPLLDAYEARWRGEAGGKHDVPSTTEERLRVLGYIE